ncbi:serine protease [Streptomyces sp. J2-1]|nr:serine protease [Streptomyces corallincola]
MHGGTGDAGGAGGFEGARSTADDAGRAHADVLVRIHDPGGRPRGVGFLADHEGTLVTSHEAVDGLAVLILRTATGRTRAAVSDAVTPLPALGLALVRTEGLDTEPLPLSVRDRAVSGAYVRIAAGGWREARVLAATPAAYRTAAGCTHHLGEALELALGTAGRDALRLGGSSGGPVLDAETGAVLGVLATGLDTGRPGGPCLAAPLLPDDGPLGALLARNAATVPAYGADLNLAGILEATAVSVAQDGPQPGPGSAVLPVERAGVVAELDAFTAGRRSVLALVGAPGSGRTTELAALAARRSADAPTLWLRGADLRAEDISVADAAGRALSRAARIVATSRPVPTADPHALTPAAVARLAARTGRPLLLLLDSPEEMPPLLAHHLAAWTRASASWLHDTGAQLVLACREEFWQRTGAGFPVGLCHVPGERAAGVRVPVGTSVSGSGEGRSPEPDTGAESEGRYDGSGAAGFPAPPSSRLRGQVDADRPASRAESAEHPPAHGKPGPAVPPPPSSPRTAAPAPAAHPPAPPGSATSEETPADPPPCLRLGDLSAAEAGVARGRYGIPEGALRGRDAGHPLVLRLLSEVFAAVPDAPPAGPADRYEVFAAHLDLVCLRVAVRLAAENGVRGTGVRRLAARVAGQVHEAARRSLGPGQGELDRDAFEAVFPWGPAPARLGGGTGWAPAVLTEGLLVPAGSGYRFAHEELADWLQGTHLDLDAALHALVHRPRDPEGAHPLPVPHHRAGPVVQALLLLGRQQGHRQLSFRLRELVDSLDLDPDSWWAARLLARTLLQVPDAAPYTEVLRLLARRLVARRLDGLPVPPEFGPGFWTDLPLPDAERFALLRELVLADGAANSGQRQGRYLDAVADALVADPAAVQPYLVGWFEDERALPGAPHATVATAAQALLHTHRHGALDDLTDVLADSAHPRAGELLGVLAEDEPSALCRAVDRWAHDPRPGRRAAAVAAGLRVVPHARSSADRALLRLGALALLVRPADRRLRGGALALLVRDPQTREEHLPQALRLFSDGDPELPPAALVAALTTHTGAVLDAFRTRLLAGPDTGELFRALAEVTTTGLARRIAALVRETLERRPDTAGHAATYVDRSLDHGPLARPVLLPLVSGLLDGGPVRVRAALATVLATPGTPVSRPLRRELLDFLLTHERDPDVLDALLHAAAPHGAGRDTELRSLVLRTGRVLAATPEGAARFDWGLVVLARHVPGFAARTARWSLERPEEWRSVVGPAARRMIERLAGGGAGAGTEAGAGSGSGSGSGAVSGAGQVAGAGAGAGVPV